MAGRPMEVALPVPVQIFLSVSDRYLAANVATWRATVVGVENLPPHTMAALAMVQADASWLNPGQEDNYYTAAAVLPWAGHVDAAQTILLRTMAVRTEDVLPPFLYAFNQLNFFGDVEGAVKALRLAQEYAPDAGAKAYFSEMEERWASRQDDPAFVVGILQKMVKNTNSIELRYFLDRQLLRLNGLIELKKAVAKYIDLYGEAPSTLDELVSSGIVEVLPVDPSGHGYSIRSGVVFMKSVSLERFGR